MLGDMKISMLIALAALLSGCDMYAEGVVVGDPSDQDQAYAGDNDDYPDDAYIASLEPEYYDGHAVYWYHGGWRYRDGGGRWSTYRSEPAALREARSRNNTQRRSTGGFSRKSTSHGGGGGGHSGGGGGGHHR
jgi:hypothetical protein